uniref:Uncharacterized protein n=1 Tax=Heterorhabditis bacteriophora TaxID=37862 RepID=A0A1I7XAW8_HETBA
MDFFDVRKLSTGYVKDSVILQDYSAIAFLPVIMIGLIIVGICGVYHYRRWRHERKQLSHLIDFYEILESSHCKHGQTIVLEQNGTFEDNESTCDRITRAMALPPTDSSPFFQPINRTKTLRFDTMHKATTATEVFHI